MRSLTTMALKTGYPYSSSLSQFAYYSNSYSHFSSSLPFRTKCRSVKTLLIANSSPTFSPIFAPHFDSNQPKTEQNEHTQIDTTTDSDSESEPEPINFFESNASNELDEPQLEFEIIQSDQEDQLGDYSSTVHEILEISRNLPENITLGEQLGDYQGKISDADCINLLKIMSHEGLVKECLHIFEWVRVRKPGFVTPKTCNVLFSALGRAHMSAEIMCLVHNLSSEKRFQDVTMYNSAILGLACCQRYDYAWEVYNMLEALNIQPNHITCSILITILRKTRGKTAKDAWDLFQKMTRKGVKWTLDSVSTLIKSFCDEGLKKEALIIQSEMEKKGISSNTFIYNTLMDAYVKSDQVEEAEGLFREMIDRGVKPSIVSYNILLGSYSKRMQPEICETLILEMGDFGINPNVQSYTSLISAYGRQMNNSEKANDAFIRMKKAGIKPNTYAYTALIHAYSISKMYDKVYNTYQNLVQEEIKPSIETYSTLLDAFRQASDTDKLIEIWQCMIRNKIEGTRVTFNIILDCVAKHGLYLRAREIILEFGKLGMGPTTMTYNMLINAYARAGQHYKIPMLLKEMSSIELKPDPITYLTIIRAYIKARDFTKAFYFHKEMVKKRLVPDAKSYAKLKASLKRNAKTKNKRDRSAILGIANSKFGMKRKQGKKDELWKGKKKRDAMLIGHSRNKYT